MEDIVAFDILKTKVLKYILYKKRTEQEIRRKFSNENENLLDEVIEYLKEAGYINDMVYIERAVNEFINLRTLSIREICYKLYSKGLKENIIQQYIDNNQEKLYEYEKNSAKKIYIKKSATLEKEDIVVFLKKKGYKEESIKFGIEEE